MSAKRSGLGRGLDALLPRSEQTIQQLPLEQLSVSALQPRKRLDPEAIAELASSIADKGVLQPILVRPVRRGFEIVAGERRFRAAQQVGLRTIPAVIKALSDRETLEIAIVENLQREDLSALEEARAFKQLMGFGLSQDAVAKAVGKSRSAVANAVRLLNLDDETLEALEEGKITAGHARALLAQAEEDRRWALERVLAEDLTVRQTERLKRPNPRAAKRKPILAPSSFEDDLTRHVGTRVRIKGKAKGRIELYYHSEDELSRLLALLGYQP